MHPSLSRRNLLVLSLSLALVLIATGAIDYSGAVPHTQSQLAAVDTGLVPCSGVLDCNLCTGVDLLQKIINFAIFLAFAIATPLFAYAGFRLMTSGGNPEGKNKAKEVFKTVGIGLILVLCGYLIVDTIIHTVIINNNPDYFGSGQSWNSVGSCNGLKRPLYNPVTNWIGGLFSIAPTVTSGVDVPNTGSTYVTGGVKGTGFGTAQCSDSNTACSVSALEDAGMTPTQANVMSCISVTEGADASATHGTGPSGQTSSACGQFQILKGTWNGISSNLSSSCRDFSSCTNASCNAQAAAALVQQSGYTAWTCANCNANAQKCVDTYSDSNLITRNE